jgi:biopolymer transport protein ExbD
VNKSRARKRRHKEVQELNITAFMNLMVVLTPFLLITAVFSRLAILELNLPAGQAQASADEAPQFQLEITVRGNAIEVGDRNAGTLNRIEKTGQDYRLDELSAYLSRVKQQFPDKSDATLLLEPGISYQVLVAVMDRVRSPFPEVSIGDAPVQN